MRLGLSAKDPLGDCKPAGLPFGAIFGGCIGRGERTNFADTPSVQRAVWRSSQEDEEGARAALACMPGRSVEILRVGIYFDLFV